MSSHTLTPPRPLGGPILGTRVMKLAAVVAALGIAVMLWRLAAGLGAVTALSDGYPWGLWIAFDVVTGTALACGGYAVAILVYILNRGRYHPLVRPAILTSALGYSLAGLSILLDVGRPWLSWKLPLFWLWNLNSTLLEVALCIMAYTVVLAVELSPAFFERGREAGPAWLRRFSGRAISVLDRALVWIVALGLVLPTMHQSSLGTLMLLTGPRLHPLWNTPWLPLLFLLSCIAMGYAAVVFESAISSAAFRRRTDMPMLAALARPIGFTVVLFLGLRLADLAGRGRFGRALAFDTQGVLFLLETALMAIPLWILASARRRSDPGHLFRAAMMLMLAGGLYRFDTYLVAFNPGPGWSYFPAVPELFMTLGIVALEVLGYVAVVRYFPILAGAAPAASRPQG